MRTRITRKRKGRVLAFATLSAATMAAGGSGSTAQASISPQAIASEVRIYRIASGSMTNALNALADVNGLQLLYDAGVTQPMKTKGLRGKYSVSEGLDRLLAGTGLTYRLAANRRTVSIQLAQAATGTRSDASAVTLPTIEIEGAGGGLGGRFTGYSPDLNKPAAASKSNIPLIQAPYSIQVVPREVIDDQQAISVQDALSNVSSVQPASDTFYDGFTIRGFDNSTIYRNNLRVVAITKLETANLQSIEVLKGPAAMLFGRVEPGGIVNLVVKRPLDVPYYSIQEQAGSWGLTRTTVDATGPITDDKTWLYRINLAYTHADSFRNFVTSQNAFIAPTITWHPIEQFRFNLDAEYQNTIFVADSDDAIPAIGTRPAPIPISRYLMDPAVTKANPTRQERVFIGYDWTFDIAKDWSLTNRFAYINVDYAQRLTNFDSICLNPGTNDPTCTRNGIPLGFGDMPRRLWDVNQSRETISSNIDLNGKLVTGPFNHMVLFGTDFFGFDQPNAHGFAGATSAVGPINIFAPTYRLSGYTKPADNFFFTLREMWKGVYAQDMISFADDRLHLLIGGRYDWVDHASGFSSDSFAAAKSTRDTTGAFDRAFSPRLGAVVQPTPWLSFYGSFSQSFGVTNGIPVPGQPPFPAQKGVQYEGGAKAELFDKRLTATMAFYDITKSNILQTVPGTQFATPIGLVRSRGAEFDIAGRIDENWSLIGSYSYDEARIVQDAITGNIGRRLINVPLNAASLWMKYDAGGDFRGLSLGGGFNVVGARQGDNANTFTLPQYTLVNAMIMYHFQPAFAPWVKNLTFQLNVKNLLGTTYYLNSFDRFSIAPGAPRTFLASIRAEF